MGLQETLGRLGRHFKTGPERVMVNGIAVAATPFSYYLDMHPLPKRMDGVRVLDIGGGFSDFTSEMIKRGAEAYAIDPVYANPDRMINGFQAYLEKSQTGYDQEQLAALKKFRESFSENPHNYVAEYATQAQFPDQHFDYVYSCSLVFGHLDKNGEVIQRVIDKITKISKDRTRIIFGPVGESIDARDEPANVPIRHQSRAQVREIVTKRGFTYDQSPYANSGYDRVLISRG